MFYFWHCPCLDWPADPSRLAAVSQWLRHWVRRNAVDTWISMPHDILIGFWFKALVVIFWWYPRTISLSAKQMNQISELRLTRKSRASSQHTYAHYREKKTWRRNSYVHTRQASQSRHSDGRDQKKTVTPLSQNVGKLLHTILQWLRGTVPFNRRSRRCFPKRGGGRFSEAGDLHCCYHLRIL